MLAGSRKYLGIERSSKSATNSKHVTTAKDKIKETKNHAHTSYLKTPTRIDTKITVNKIEHINLKINDTYKHLHKPGFIVGHTKIDRTVTKIGLYFTYKIHTYL